MKEKSVKKLLALKSSIHNDACAVGPRWAARCGVLGRARMPAYERVLRPCLAVAHRTPTTKAIMNRALRGDLQSRGHVARSHHDEERVDDSRRELRPSSFTQLLRRFVERKRAVVWAVGRHCVPRVGEPDDRGLE